MEVWKKKDFNSRVVHLLPGSLGDESEVVASAAVSVVAGHSSSDRILRWYNSTVGHRQMGKMVGVVASEEELVAGGRSSSDQILHWYSSREELLQMGKMEEVASLGVGSVAVARNS
uniref:Uncharacterized protein n=1 Tax=Anopheles atroparvus TaxID=41427 RepID=A0A182IS58_ANOAO